MSEVVKEGPALINPFDLLEEHKITSSASAPRHDCRCGASFVIDLDAERPYAGSGEHIREVMVAAAHAARALLARVDNRGSDLPAPVRDLLEDIAADAGD
ncbi:MAG TPA: hypothetical protein VF885_13505 [Arthrobacter sp.]